MHGAIKGADQRTWMQNISENADYGRSHAYLRTPEREVCRESWT
jgi:hypothetical protein